MSLGSVGGSADASHTMRLSFMSPYIMSFERVNFYPSESCIEELTQYGDQESLAGLVIVREALFAEDQWLRKDRGERQCERAWNRRGPRGDRWFV